jgi:NCS1 family nucleobase:cation symporter-1
MIGPAVTDGNVVTAIADLTGQRVAFFIMLLLAPGVAVAGAICLYGGALAMITLGHTLLPRWRITHRARIVIASGIFVAALLIGIAGERNFLPLYSDFNELLLYLLVPWTAVNLIDYYLIRFGDYHVPSFFAADGGVYGHYNVTALACYLVGIVVQIPFVAADFYTGPLARAMGGVDISWLVGIAVVSPVYYFAMRSIQRPLLVERGEGRL